MSSVSALLSSWEGTGLLKLFLRINRAGGRCSGVACCELMRVAISISVVGAVARGMQK